MKTLKVKDKEILCFEIPLKSEDFSINNDDISYMKFYPSDKNLNSGEGYMSEEYIIGDFKKYEILGKLSDILQNDVLMKKYVNGFFKHDNSQKYDCFEDYERKNGLTYPFDNIKDSFISLLKSQNINCKLITREPKICDFNKNEGWSWLYKQKLDKYNELPDDLILIEKEYEE